MTEIKTVTVGNQIQKEKREYALRTLPEHRRLAGRWEDLYKLLTNFEFLEDKCSYLSIFDLEVDFQTALQTWRGLDDQKGILEKFEERLRLESPHIQKSPELLFPSLYNHLTWLDAPNGPVHTLVEKAKKMVHTDWLCMLQDPRPSPQLWLKSFEGHTREINCLTVTGDGVHLVSGSSDGTIRMWRLSSGQLVRTFIGHTKEVEAILITPDGKKMVSGSYDATVKIWDLSTGQLLGSFEDHTNGVSALSMTPDGKRIISASTDHTIRIWGVDTGLTAFVLNFQVTALDVTPDGTKVVAGSSDGIINVWSVDSGLLINTLGVQLGEIGSISITQDGEYIISCSTDGRARIFRLGDGRLIKSIKTEGHKVKITGDMSYAVSLSNASIVGGTIQVWDLSSGKLVRTLVEESHNHVEVIISPNDKWIVSAEGFDIVIRELLTGRRMNTFSVGEYVNRDKMLLIHPAGNFMVIAGGYQIQIRDLMDGKVLRSFEDHPSSITTSAITPDGSQILAGYWDGGIVLWDSANGRKHRELVCHDAKVNALALTDHGRKIISGSDDRTIRFWDCATGVCNLILQCENAVTAIAVTPDGHHVVSGMESGAIAVWQIDTGQLLFTMQGHSSRVNEVVVTPDGSYGVSASSDATINVWDCATWQKVNLFKGHSSCVRTIIVTQDGKYCISGGDDNILILWKLTTGQPFAYFEGHSDTVFTVAFIPGENQFISCSKDGSIKIWPLQPTSKPRSIDGRSGEVKSAALTPDGTEVFSGSLNGYIKLWNAYNGELEKVFGGHQDSVIDLKLIQDGKQLISASSKAIKIWDVDSGQVLYDLTRSNPEKSIVAIAGLLDDRQIAFAGAEYLVNSWNLENGDITSLTGQYVPITAVALTTDKLIVASQDGTVRAWMGIDTPNRSFVSIGMDTIKMMVGDRKHRSEEYHVINSLVVTPDEARVLFSFDNRIKICDLKSGRTIGYLDGHSGLVKALSISRNGDFLFSASDDRTIQLWDLNTGNSRIVFGLDTVPSCMTLSIDDRLLVCGDTAGHVWVFEWMK